ncbi:hypothetical protein Pcinc_026681 [Petrolisthes cinctipes]|uniref:Diacylglycerol kinase n=1 Tax=Petrolisthes cinctipes TaxID=88211 RepID=A0AAE1F5E0_PETCI|nr:hypothetical protein Pcinc_026681 [Petrolisthes cinctipes]
MSFLILAWIAVLLVLALLLIKLTQRPYHHDLRARDVLKGHRWCSLGSSNTCFCNICETLAIGTEGMVCDSCGVCAESQQCISAADRTLQCKVITTKTATHKHHWVRGNLPENAQCEVCEEDCGVESGLSDWRCCWCQHCVHQNCILNVAEVCDFGRFRNYIVPPNCIRLKFSRIRRTLLVKEVLEPNVNSWSPIIIVGNRKSGSLEADTVLSSFRHVLNPAQVIDLAEQSPQEALEWCHLLPPHVTCRVVVAGGDGTVGWVFNAIQKMSFEKAPQVAILPLGTGNDLSRVLGFGEGHSCDVDVVEYLDQLATASPAKLDRWKVHYDPPRNLGIRMPAKEVYMNNYLSVGVDALVTLNFHRARQSPFYIFSHRQINKLVYFTYGTKDVLERECNALEERLEVYMDGVQVELPNMEAVVILNIPTWGAGVRPWTLGAGGATAPKQDFSDGRLEVFCLSSSFHIAQLQVGLSEPIRLGQCSTVKLCLKGAAPMQVDGEPWEQNPGTITLTHSHQASVLVRQQ